jgi:arylsulfatase A-like enzyme
MRAGSRAIGIAVALAHAACAREAFRGPLRLLECPTLEGRPPLAGAVGAGGETRPALLASARFRVPLPRRPLLTYAFGSAWTGPGEAPGWLRLAVRAAGRVVDERTLNPRAARGFRDVSLALDGLGRQTVLEFELRVTDRDARPLEAPPGLLFGVAEPTLHDLDDYGRARGVVLVSIDTLRRDHVGAHGYPRPTTPRLDALARGGILCEDAVSTASWTLPAHLSLLSSASPGVHGATDMGRGFNRRVPTLPSLLRAAGYATQAVTSHLYVSEVYGLDVGFERLDFRQDRKAGEVVEMAIDRLDRLGDRPFLLFLHFYDPHWHYDPPPDRLRLFEEGYAGQVTGLWQDFSRRDPKRLAPQDLAHLLALYDGEIRYVDDELGRLLDHMKRRGLDRGTLLVVTSDHGEEFLDHGSWEHQKTLYEEVVRVPLIVAGPGVAARREAAQATLLDVAPTVLAWAGLPAPASFEGRSLLGPLGAREAYGETDHTVDRSRKLFLRAGAGRWKAILSLAPDGGSLRGEEWYDLAADPREIRPGAAPPAARDAIRERALARWRADRSRGAGAPEVALTEEQRERLQALGYVGR